MHRVPLLLLLLQPLSLIHASPAAAAESRPPNVVFILIDDLGWMDLACQGNRLVETPRIDLLAADGMRFTDAYAAAPVCSPTRAAILTGKSPARLRITNHIPDQQRFVPDDARWLPAEMLDHLPLEHVTVAERLKQAGYATAFMGKWHLSGDGRLGDGGRGRRQFAPEAQGFDLNIGGCAYGGPPSFFAPYRIHNIEERREGEYLPYRLADEAAQFIRRHPDQPFALFLWNYTVHWPMQAPEPLLEKYADRTGPGLNDVRYGAMIEAMDEAVGRVLDELDRCELRDETLVVFTSDNGGFMGVADNRPLRMGKGYLYEGGIRVPLIVRWPGQVRPGSTSDEPVVSMDVYPTILAAAGIETEADESPDGVNILPVLRGEAPLAERRLLFHYPNYAWHRSNRLGGAVRAGRYKLIEHYDDGSVELYDLEKDLSETRELSQLKPRLAATLQQELRQWRDSVDASMPRMADRAR